MIVGKMILIFSANAFWKKRNKNTFSFFRAGIALFTFMIQIFMRLKSNKDDLYF